MIGPQLIFSECSKGKPFEPDRGCYTGKLPLLSLPRALLSQSSSSMLTEAGVKSVRRLVRAVSEVLILDHTLQIAAPVHASSFEREIMSKHACK